MTHFEVFPIGKIINNESGSFIEIEPKFIPALTALEGFSYINVIWWFSDSDTEEARSMLQMPQPYKKAPETMGVFATRSPIRPNPIALSAAEVIHIDYQNGLIEIAYIDANDGTPVLDIKPYTPSLDRVENQMSRNGAASGRKALKNLRTLHGRMYLISNTHCIDLKIVST